MKKLATVFGLLIVLSLLIVPMAGCSAKSTGEVANRAATERLIIKNLDLNYPTYPMSYVVSPDLRRIAYIQQIDNWYSVVIDGVAGKQYDRVENLTFSPDGKRVGYVAKSGTRKIVVLEGKETATYDYVEVYNGLTFSPDGQHVAYVLHKLDVSGTGPDLWHAVVLDGVEGKHYPGVGNPVFSPDSIHMVYLVGLGDGRQIIVTDGAEGKISTGIMQITWSSDSQKFLYRARNPATGKEAIVVNGVEGKQYSFIWGTNYFSPDGKKVIYVVMEGSDSFLVVDGVESSRYQGNISGPYYSPDGSRMAYQVRLKTGKAFMVIDGKESERYDSLGGYWFSPEGSHVAYTAMTNNKWFLVVDGVQERELDRVSNFTLSPDWRRVAYVNKFDVEKGTKSVMVIDGTAGKQYASISDIVFSPDSRRLVYVAHPDLYGQVLVENGAEGKRYNWSGSSSSSDNSPGIKPVFSSDSEHLAYTVTLWDGKLKVYTQAVVFDGKQGKEYDKVNNLQFTADGKHLFYIAYIINDKKDPRSQRWYVVIDGEEREYTVLLNGKVVFDSDNTLHYLANKGKDVYLVEEKLK